ncbi:MAG: hypothetical protein ACT4P5_00590, partial [Armatimonadota bacterium]
AAGGRKQASRSLGVHEKVLGMIGQLSSTRGDESTVRKVTTAGPLKPLSPAETTWLEHAVRVLIRRLGEHASGASLARIPMADLPRV